jgi:ribosomal protein L35
MSTTKTNKSYLKRIKVTKNGKLIARKPGQNHYNAKERTGTSMSKRRTQVITMSNKARSRFLSTSN